MVQEMKVIQIIIFYSILMIIIVLSGKYLVYIELKKQMIILKLTLVVMKNMIVLLTLLKVEVYMILIL